MMGLRNNLPQSKNEYMLAAAAPAQRRLADSGVIMMGNLLANYAMTLYHCEIPLEQATAALDLVADKLIEQKEKNEQDIKR